MKKNPFNDDDYTGNDEQITDLKELASAAISALKTLREDIRMLQNREWEPDYESCQASIDTADKIILPIEGE